MLHVPPDCIHHLNSYTPEPPAAVAAKVISVPTTLGLETSLVRLVIESDALAEEVAVFETTYGTCANA
jgi:hypothetical protein